MKQYLDAVKEILETGTRKENRTGIDTLSTFGVFYKIDLQRGFPLLTTKKISWKNIVVEMLWFLSGQTDISILKRHKCEFWTPWADSRGKVPSAYGAYWRRFPVHGTIDSSDIRIDGDDCIAFNDQLKWLVNTLKRDPMSRRMVVSAWAPGNAQTSKLPPCHCMFVVNVQNENGRATCPQCGFLTCERNADVHCDKCGWNATVEQRLCLHLTQRSCDIALGVPYNIASYALLMHLLSRFSGIPVGTFAHSLVDAHAYTAKPDGSMAEWDHVPGLREQLTREPRTLPTLEISDEIKSLEDVERLIASNADTDEVMRHFVLRDYQPWPAINFKVAV